jgi:uncharacterized phage protein (TIGR01671 family)
MRTLKFRAWDKEPKVMRYLGQDPNHDTLWFSPTGEGRYYNLQNGSGGDEYEIMQYTGIDDQDGKEIYEMDIVQKGDEIGLVVYNEGQYNLIWTPHNKSRKGGASRLLKTNALNNTFPSPANYVLGNYYENPDLIPEIDYELIKNYWDFSK